MSDRPRPKGKRCGYWLGERYCPSRDTTQVLLRVTLRWLCDEHRAACGPNATAVSQPAG